MKLVDRPLTYEEAGEIIAEALHQDDHECGLQFATLLGAIRYYLIPDAIAVTDIERRMASKLLGVVHATRKVQR